MYPESVRRVIIDGVFDGYDYRDALWSSNLHDTEEVIDSLFTYCHRAGPLKCALYEPTAAAIRERYFRAVEAVEGEPVSVPLAEPPLVITRKMLSLQLFQASTLPLAGYGLVVDTIRALEDNSKTALAALAPQIAAPVECDSCSSPPAPWAPLTDASYAIACGDAPARAFDADAFAEHYARLVDASPTGGPFWAWIHLVCMDWRVRPAWRYTGPLSAPNGTAHPLLILQPRWDPLCPLHDARLVRERYAGAGMLLQNSHGHCSISSPSVCTARHIRRYLEDGVLPKEGAECEVDELPFVGVVRDVSALSVDDAELLDAMRGLSFAVPKLGVM